MFTCVHRGQGNPKVPDHARGRTAITVAAGRGPKCQVKSAVRHGVGLRMLSLAMSIVCLYVCLPWAKVGDVVARSEELIKKRFLSGALRPINTAR